MSKATSPAEFTQHPLSAAFPSMSASEFSELVSDIQANGLEYPIMLYQGMVLDGWHRYKACVQLGQTAETYTLPEREDPVAFVLSLNLHRRHLTGAQRAAAVVACSAWAQSGDNQHTRGGEVAAPPVTVAQMAQAAEVSPRTIQQAKRAQEAGLGEAVREGKVSAERAAELAKLPADERQAALEAPTPKPLRLKAADPEEIQKLRARIAELENQVHELATTLEASEDDNQSMARVLEADDKVKAALDEAKRFREHARVIEERNKGLMTQNAELTKSAKGWMRKAQNLERQAKAAADVA